MNNSSRDTILIGDHDTLRFRTSLKKGEKILFSDSVDSLSSGVELLSSPVTDTIKVDGDNVDVETSIIVTSFDSGSYKLPSFEAYKVRSDGSVDTLSFEAGELHVKTIEIDTSSFSPFDVKQQMNYPFTVRDVLPWTALLLLIILLFFIIRYITGKVKGRKSLFSPKASNEPPHLRALRKLEELNSLEKWKSNQKEYFSDLTEILREYIEERYSVAAMEKTSNEIYEDLSRSPLIEDNKVKELYELFRLSDLVKFAKYVAADTECKEALTSAIRFVNSTIEVNTATQINKEENSHEGGE